MITTPRIFRDDHLPRELKHRETEIRTLSRALEPTLRGDSANDILISGPSGVGKTALARHVLRKLQERVHVESSYCRCVGKTEGDLLRSILQDHSAAPDPPGNRPVADLQIELCDLSDAPLVVVLDEAEGLAGADMMINLLSLPQLSIVAICHESQAWLAEAPTRVCRAFGQPIQADRYTTAELADILEARAARGLAGNVVDREQLEWIADEAVGVAREGIQALRAAAELAEERKHDTIRAIDIQDSFDRARRRIREANLRSLALHHQLLYAIIHDAGEIEAGDLHERYDAIADALYEGRPRAPIGRRARRNKLRKLREYDLVTVVDSAQDRHYRCRDRSVQPPADLDARQTI